MLKIILLITLLSGAAQAQVCTAGENSLNVVRSSHPADALISYDDPRKEIPYDDAGNQLVQDDFDYELEVFKYDEYQGCSRYMYTWTCRYMYTHFFGSKSYSCLDERKYTMVRGDEVRIELGEEATEFVTYGDLNNGLDKMEQNNFLFDTTYRCNEKNQISNICPN